MINTIPLVLFASVVLVLVGCSNEEPANTGVNAPEAAQVAPSAPASLVQPTSDSSDNTGRVLSSVNVPGYTYIEVESNGRTVWIAGNPVEVKEGEIIGWDQSTVMKNFYSKTLQRTFDEVIFVAKIRSSNPQVAKTMPGTMAPTFPAATVAQIQNLSHGSVISAENAANYTYLEIKTSDEGVIWLAAPETAVSVDDTIEWQRGSLMKNFTSSTLGKTFPEIYFVKAVQVKN
jgi:hypothetical protein